MKIGIAGSTIEEGDPIYEKLERLGGTIAERGHTLVTGRGDTLRTRSCLASALRSPTTG